MILVSSNARTATPYSRQAIASEWAMTDDDEVGSWRAWPVLGRISFRAQNTLAVGLLMAGMVVLVGLVVGMGNQSRSMGDWLASDTSLRQSLKSLTSVRRDALLGNSVDPTRWQSILTQGESSLQRWQRAGTTSADLASRWQDITKSARSVLEDPEIGMQVVMEARAINNDLNDLIPRLDTLVQQAFVDQQMTPDLLRTMNDLHDWRDMSAEVVAGNGLAATAAAARQDIEQRLRAFAGSPQASAQTSLTQAWRTLAAAWPRLQPRLDLLVTYKDRWAQWHTHLSTLQSDIDATQMIVDNAGSGVLVAHSNHEGMQKGLWAAALLMLIGSVLLMAIGRHHRRRLAFKMVVENERIDREIAVLVEAMSAAAMGDLAHKPPGLSGRLTPLSNEYERLLLALRQGWSHVRQAVLTTATTIARTNEQGGALGETVSIRANRFDQRMQTLPQPPPPLPPRPDWNAHQEGLRRLFDALADWKDRQKEAMVYVSDIRSRLGKQVRFVQEALSETPRVNEWADQASVLAVQTSLLAAKTGKETSGLSRLAQEIDQLARRAARISADWSARGAPAQNETQSVMGEFDAMSRDLADQVAMLARLEDDHTQWSQAWWSAVQDLDGRWDDLRTLVNEHAALVVWLKEYMVANGHLESQASEAIQALQQLNEQSAVLSKASQAFRT